MRFFRRNKPPRIEVKVMPSTAMKLTDWRMSPELVRYAKRLMDDPQFQILLSVLRNESPSNYGVPYGATHDDRIAHACKAEGYHLALNNLEALAEEEKKPIHIEATFAPEPPREHVPLQR